jgi:hypothetical protein
LTKKVRGGCALAGADMQKPYASKCGQGEIKIPVSGFFTKIAYFQVMNFIPVKVSILYVQSRAINFGRQGHYLTQLKMVDCKTIVNNLSCYDIDCHFFSHFFETWA